MLQCFCKFMVRPQKTSAMREFYSLHNRISATSTEMCGHQAARGLSSRMKREASYQQGGRRVKAAAESWPSTLKAQRDRGMAMSPYCKLSFSLHCHCLYVGPCFRKGSASYLKKSVQIYKIEISIILAKCSFCL